MDECQITLDEKFLYFTINCFHCNSITIIVLLTTDISVVTMTITKSYHNVIIINVIIIKI